MRNTFGSVATIVVLWLVLVAPACGLLNQAAANAGNPRADTVEGRELAQRADHATTDWMLWLLYGQLPVGFALGKAHEKRATRKRAVVTAAPRRHETLP